MYVIYHSLNECMYVCSDKLRELLPSILPRLLELLQDHEYFVRECACFALG